MGGAGSDGGRDWRGGGRHQLAPAPFGRVGEVLTQVQIEKPIGTNRQRLAGVEAVGLEPTTHG